jgi:hypothetical protein
MLKILLYLNANNDYISIGFNIFLLSNLTIIYFNIFIIKIRLTITFLSIHFLMLSAHKILAFLGDILLFF